MSDDPSRIPVIDFGPFMDGTESSRRAVAGQMRQASKEWGFFYLAQCGMPQTQLADAFSASRSFFSLPIEEKNRVAWQNAQSNRGYVGIRRERLDPSRPGDLKEAFNLAPEEPGPDAPRNLWPSGHGRFKDVMSGFLEECICTADRVLEAFALALDQSADFFVDAHSHHHHTLRLLHYPPLPEGFEPLDGESRAGAHTDYGSITLLFQDEVGGLEVRTRAGDWVRAAPIPGTVVVNTGDLMHRWTNHVFCSTPHRVNVAPEFSHRDRYSIAFFCHPNKDAEIACIDSCATAESPAIYEPISAGRHLQEKLANTYGA
ncbi:2-oxoglutarate and iron-dependent oxygenase domain-containing protein [uncultured Marinobacter sp.]|uniref:isopenicillin N synthase family dioxygenase n=1 Tax=uncultured Marinobacter sp. TaxID=187379 RepID=UPI0030D7B3BE